MCALMISKCKLYPFLLVILFAGGIQTLSGQTIVLTNDPDFRETARSAIDSLYNRNTGGAEKLLEPWKREFPGHPVWALWEGMELWWEVLDDLFDTSNDEEFFHAMRKADYEAGQLLRNEPDHPDALVIRTVANGYEARHHSNREEWLTSMNIGRRAYQSHQRLVEINPDLPDNYFAEGLKLYYSAYLPEAYPVVRAVSWFLPEGDKEEGLKNLELAAEKAIFAGPEAKYFSGNILLNYEEEYQLAKQHFQELVDKYPNNGYYRRLYIRTLFQLNEYSETITASENALSHWEQNPELPGKEVMEEEVYYWMGRSNYHQGQLFDAKDAFIQSIELGLTLPNTKNRRFHTLSAFYAGRSSENLNNTDEAKKYYEITLAQNESQDVKEVAKNRLKTL